MFFFLRENSFRSFSSSVSSVIFEYAANNLNNERNADTSETESFLFSESEKNGTERGPLE